MAPPPPQLSDQVLAELLRARHLPVAARRVTLWTWWLSHVERVHLADGTSVVVKLARPPMDGEARILRALTGHLPVADLLADQMVDGQGVAMLLEDLGPPLRLADLHEVGAAARCVHAATAPTWLPQLGEQQLAKLPERCLTHLAQLQRTERWANCDELERLLQAAAPIAAGRSAGARLPPFGLCHSEFHSSSLHVSQAGWKLLDWARAFQGPGLLDIASWQGTPGAVSTDACRGLIDAYLAAGGAADAATPRAGLASERWALGWHRLWVVEWYLYQASRWPLDPDEDRDYQAAIRRHLEEALSLLDA